MIYELCQTETRSSDKTSSTGQLAASPYGEVEQGLPPEHYCHVGRRALCCALKDAQWWPWALPTGCPHPPKTSQLQLCPDTAKCPQEGKITPSGNLWDWGYCLRAVSPLTLPSVRAPLMDFSGEHVKFWSFWYHIYLFAHHCMPLQRIQVILTPLVLLFT